MEYLKKISILTIVLICSLTSINAQQLKGIVHELNSSERLQDVIVKNLRTNNEVTSNRDGEFLIDGALNDLLTFSQTGYQTDTVFVYEHGIQRVYLVRDNNNIVIDEVLVTRLTDSRLAAEIATARNEGKVVEASQNRGGLRVSPSRLFGRKSKQARGNLNVLITEQQNRKVDRLFSEKLIRSIIPISAEELPLFRDRYRPELKFIETASAEDMRIYVLDSYSKFKKL
ncbi:MAG: hypothetical protein ACTJHT_04280 [Sphingobacterium sp.]|uniref:hypothetical protein n=1 Tax=Sphingobacterium sp. JB170 TaxID=1434842 RepID=UPI00097EA3A9|nr:hypothetical protein [Sphingobacterium sp. JB170]SJN44900.1 hypothetical protein FM107_13260 [Sphingobacterium sp. JB170]